MPKKIKLNLNKETIVDDNDFVIFNKYRWRFNTTGYATRTYKSISLAREIMNAKKGEYVDHINGDKLDNRKINLRITNNQQNCWNKLKINKGKNKFRGVRSFGKKWKAYSFKNNKQIQIGIYDKEIDAAIEYDKWIIKNRGEYGITNKILNNF